jgi:hypothetical protein
VPEVLASPIRIGGDAVKESALQDAIRLALGSVPGLVLWRNNIGVADVRDYKVRFGVGGPGGADLIGCLNGRFIAIEVKTATGRQSNDQRIFQALVESKGGVYVILRSVDDAKAWIANHA